MFWSKLVRGFIDLVYPPVCWVCGRDSQQPLCTSCIGAIEVIAPPFCERCGKPVVEAGPDCRDCRGRRLYLRRARALGVYDGTLKQAVHALKFEHGRRVAYPLAQLALATQPAETWRVDVVTFVPMHPTKRRERGYNQAELLARALARRIEKPVWPILKVARRTKDQSQLDLAARRQNVRDAFRVRALDERSAARLRGRRILLVDDVFTSGATANECARALKRAGAGEVDVFAAARTVWR